MYRYVFIIAILLLGCSQLIYAEDITVEELIRELNRARLIIQSGELTSIISVERAATKTEEEIAKSIQEEKERELENFEPDPFYPDVDVKKFEVDYLIPSLNYGANMYRKRTEIEHSTTIFQLDGPENRGPLNRYLYKVTITDSPGIPLDSETARHHQAGVFYLLVDDAETQVKQNIGDIVYPHSKFHSVQFFAPETHAGFWHFAVFGRSATPVPDDAQLISKENVDGADCYVLKMMNPNGWEKKIWVDPKIDFCVRKLVLRALPVSDKVERITEFKAFEKISDVWFPKIQQSTLYRRDGNIRAKLRTEITDAQFNVEFPKSFFEIEKDFYFKQIQRQGMGFLPNAVPETPEGSQGERLLLSGPKTLMHFCELLKVQTNIDELKKLSDYNPNKGTTFMGLIKASTQKGIPLTNVEATVEMLTHNLVQLPAITLVDGNHFLIFDSADWDGLNIIDPAQKYDAYLPWNKVSEIWSGELLIYDKRNEQQLTPIQVPLVFSDEPTHDIGTVFGGSKVEHTFTIKNIGQKPLNILSVTKTYAGSASVRTKNEIPTGKTAGISSVLQVSSGNYPIQEYIYVETDDPVQNTLTLVIKGKAFTPLKTFPDTVSVGQKKLLLEPLSRRVSIHLQKDTQILAVRTDSEYIKAVLEIKNDIPHVNMRFLPTLPVGKFNQYLMIDYKHKGKKGTHSVWVYGEVLGDLLVTPNPLNLGVVEDPLSLLKTITISSRKKLPFQISAVKSSNDHINVTFKKEQNGTSYKLTATISPNAKSGDISCEILIHTSNPDQRVVRIPVYGKLADAK